MNDLLDDFRSRRSLVTNMNYQEASSRLSGFIEWLEANEVTKSIISSLKNETKVTELLKQRKNTGPPSASSPEDFAMLGLYFMREASDGKELFRLASKYNIYPSYQTTSLQASVDEIVLRYIEPALDYIENSIIDLTNESKKSEVWVGHDISSAIYPLEISQSLQSFIKDHSSARQTAFIMMRFGKTKIHTQITQVIKDVLSKYEIVALRADDKQYHDDLFPNVLTYVYGCDFGIAVFERLETDNFNPNVALEVGYMRALKKPVCLLKDRTIEALQTDLLGKLYKSFDPQDPTNSIPGELEKWLRDKDIIT